MANQSTTPIKNLVSFWEEGLREHRHQMPPSTIVLTEHTILRLKRLEGLIGDKEDIVQ